MISGKIFKKEEEKKKSYLNQGGKAKEIWENLNLLEIL